MRERAKSSSARRHNASEAPQEPPTANTSLPSAASISRESHWAKSPLLRSSPSQQNHPVTGTDSAQVFLGQGGDPFVFQLARSKNKDFHNYQNSRANYGRNDHLLLIA
jgi:hypothetical protein